MKKHVASSLFIALCAVAFVSSPAATENATPTAGAASPNYSLPEWLKNAEEVQAPGLGKSWLGPLLPSETVETPNLWDWENILSTFLNERGRATEQLPARVASENEHGSRPVLSAPAANLSSLALTGNYPSIPDPAQSSAARISADLLRPATPRQDAAAGALTFDEFSNRLSSQSTRTLEDYGNSYGESFSGGRTFDASAVAGAFASVGSVDARKFPATVIDGGEDFEPDIIPGDDSCGTSSSTSSSSSSTSGTPTPPPSTPEPSTWAAAALALLAVGYTERRRLRALAAWARGSARS